MFSAEQPGVLLSSEKDPAGYVHTDIPFPYSAPVSLPVPPASSPVLAVAFEAEVQNQIQFPLPIATPLESIVIQRHRLYTNNIFI